MDAGFDGVILRRQAERVEADGEQHVIPLHPALARNHLKAGIRLDMAHVHARAAGIGEFHQRVEFGLIGAVERAENAFLFPTVLPFLFGSPEIVVHKNSSKRYVRIDNIKLP